MSGGRKSIRKMGTRGGQPHYGLSCHGCAGVYGRENVLVVAHLTREACESVWAAHVAANHGRTS